VGAVGLAYDPTDPAKYDPNNPKQDTKDYRRWLRPYVGFECGWDQTLGREFDTNPISWSGHRRAAAVRRQLDFGGSGSGRSTTTAAASSLPQAPEEDLVQRYYFGLERRFVLVPGERDNRNTLKIDRVMMTLRADVRLTDDDSNVVDRLGEAVYSYDRAIYGLSVAFQFN